MSEQGNARAAVLMDQVTVAILTSSPGDMRKLGEILSSFEELGRLAEAEGWPEVIEASKAADGILTALMFKDDLRDAREDALGFLSSLAVFCQRAARGEGRNRADLVKILSEAAARLGIAFAGFEAVSAGPSDDGKGPQGAVVLDQDQELYTDFITESGEHLQAIEVKMVDLEASPEDPEIINAIFRGFHTIKGVSGFLNLKDVNELSHHTETLLDLCRQGKVPISSAVIDVVFEAVDAIKGMVRDVSEKLAAGVTERILRDNGAIIAHVERVQKGLPAGGDDGETGPLLLGDILVQQGKVDRKELESAVAGQLGTLDHPPIGKVLIDAGKVTPKDVSQALRVQKGGVSAAQDIRVDVGKLDGLVEMVGELVIAQALVGNDPDVKGIESPRLYRNLSHLSRITSELQKIAMVMRMVPIRNTFQKMSRLVRDLAKKSGKEVALRMEGEETEIDRNMVEEIHDPLVHMIRNSVDHGVEPADVRAGQGKTPFGTVTLRAFHQGGNVVLSVEDDGRGIDPGKIVAKAKERRLVAEGATLSEQEIFALLFEPGFSTAEKVTDISGRGVGMDVVRKNVEKLRGTIEIKSRPGQGSTFSIKIPLTLAIIDGIVVRVGRERYVIPANSVIESLRPRKEDYFTVEHRGELIRVRGELLPLVRLGRLFGVPGEETNPFNALAVVVEHDKGKRALLVDELLGKQEVVIKSLGGGVAAVRGISGGAIMGDGRVGLILDVAGLFALTGRQPACA
ncbi:MAG: chemotaxis protein CheA [Candidatus Deferrimicrobiaceae bacterium]